VAGGSLNGTATTSDPNLWKNTLFFDGGHIRNILIHMTAARAGGVQVYWGTNGTGFTGGQVVAASYTTSNTWQVVTVPMYVHPAWSNDSISSLRIDPISAANTAFQIDWIVGSDGDYDHDSLTDAEEGFGDTNGDGVPDAFDEDSDGDGRGDRQETVAGKDPYYAADGECAFISLGDAQGWIPANCANFRVTNGFLSATSSSNDPMLSRGGYYFAGADVKKIQVYLRSSAVASVQLFWGIQGNDVFSGSRVKTVAYTTTNAWQLVTFDMTGNTNWVGQVIQSLRLDPVNVNAALFDIDYIRAQP
jgi:hypothetical protein